jgi:hypothetical protein
MLLAPWIKNYFEYFLDVVMFKVITLIAVYQEKIENTWFYIASHVIVQV